MTAPTPTPGRASDDDLRRIVLDCTDQCYGPDEHSFYIGGGGFRWQRPRLTVYVPADRSRRAGLNRYPHNVIGAAVVLFGRCWSLTWKGSPPRD